MYEIWSPNYFKVLNSNSKWLPKKIPNNLSEWKHNKIQNGRQKTPKT